MRINRLEQKPLKINSFHSRGFTLVEIMLVVAIIGLLAAVAIPNYVKARNASQASACINNMRQIDNAIQQWALETGQAARATPDSAVVTPYFKGGLMPTCPAGNSTYTFPGDITEEPVVECPNAGKTPPHIMPS